jgi:hypothetical protein
MFGPTATPIIFWKISIEGNGATLQWMDRWSPRQFAFDEIDEEHERGEFDRLVRVDRTQGEAVKPIAEIVVQKDLTKVPITT